MLMAGDELLSIIFWCVVAYRACAADEQLCFRARRLAGPRRVQISLFIGLDSSPTHTQPTFLHAQQEQISFRNPNALKLERELSTAHSSASPVTFAA